jgi:hypothetical protein
VPGKILGRSMPQTIYSSLYSGGQTESKTLLNVKMDVFLYAKDYRRLLRVKWWEAGYGGLAASL